MDKARRARDHVRAVGSSTVLPFAKAVAEELAKSNPDIPAPIVESTGTGAGMKLFCAGVGVQGGLGSSQIDLGLAAARAAEEQKGAGMGGDLREDVGLLGAEDDGGNVCGGRGRCER